MKKEMKKKTVQKILCAFLAALMLGAYTGTALPQYTGTGITAEAAIHSDFEYYYNTDGTLTITKYNGTSSDVVIPSKIRNSKVTKINNKAFYNNTGLKSVTVPDSITKIGYQAFCGCTGLKSIKIGNGVKEIGSQAFYDCTGLSAVTLPNSVTSIADKTFGECTGLKSITIGKGVTKIGSSAFINCTGLTDVTIPGGVTMIDRSAFYGCSGLKNITIQNGVTSIDDFAFSKCTGLTSIKIPESVTKIGILTFYNCPKLTIYGKKNSYAYRYAENNAIPFRSTTDTIVTDVKLNTTRTWMGRGETYQLNATISPSNAENKKLTWTSSNNNIATVSNGKVTAKKDGTVTITAKASSGKTASCKITVQPPASKITLNKSTLYLGVGEQFQLTSSVQSGTASAKRGFASSDNSICYTSGNGLLTAKKIGTAYITVKTFNGKTAKCKAVVQPPAKAVHISKSWLTLHVGQNFQLSSWVDAGTASTKRAWSSSDNSTVYTSGNGLLTAKKEGTAYITVKTYNGVSSTLKVKVIK